jgi:multisubunit Na+/H+ antiporter MnhE subunit
VRSRRLTFWLRAWVALYVLYVLLVFKTELAELVAGAICAAIAATGAELVRRRADVDFRPGVRWVRALPALARDVVTGTLRMVPLVWRAARGERIEGRMRYIRFPGAGRTDAVGQTRRTLEKVLGSVAPNSYVVGFDERHDVVVVHQLEPTEEPPRVDWGVP